MVGLKSAVVHVPKRPLRSNLQLTSVIQTPVLRAAALFAGVALLDRVLSVEGVGRMLYLIPVWAIAEHDGHFEAAIAAGFGVLLYALVGSGGHSVAAASVHLVVALLVAWKIDRHARTAAQFNHQAKHDELTGVAKRGTLEKYAERALNECVRDGQPFTVAVIDCDKFKTLNDVYGHAFGDEILKTLTKCLQGAVGHRGMIGRTGGDEFVVVFPRTDRTEADQRLRKAAENFADTTLARGCKSTFSVGLATSPDQGVFLDRLLLSADDDMYIRKAMKKSQFEMSA